MNEIEIKLRLAALLMIIGLLVELGSLFWHSPLSFVIFVSCGGTAMAAGILMFFYHIVRLPKEGA